MYRLAIYFFELFHLFRQPKTKRMVCMLGSTSTVGDAHPIKRMMKVFLPEALILTKKNVIKLIQKLTGDHSNVFTDHAVIMEHYTYLIKGFNNMAMGHGINHEISNEVNQKIIEYFRWL